MYLQVGYGLEGALPDALAKRIIENEIKPYFHNGDFDAGLRAGVTAILAATKGEYKGTGRTAANRAPNSSSPIAITFVIIIIIWLLLSKYSSRGTVYSRSGRMASFAMGSLWAGGGGGGFSGGGGGFGGGGAGGSW